MRLRNRYEDLKARIADNTVAVPDSSGIDALLKQYDEEAKRLAAGPTESLTADDSVSTRTSVARASVRTSRGAPTNSTSTAWVPPPSTSVPAQSTLWMPDGAPAPSAVNRGMASGGGTTRGNSVRRAESDDLERSVMDAKQEQIKVKAVEVSGAQLSAAHLSPLLCFHISTYARNTWMITSFLMLSAQPSRKPHTCFVLSTTTRPPAFRTIWMRCSARLDSECFHAHNGRAI